MSKHCRDSAFSGRNHKRCPTSGSLKMERKASLVSGNRGQCSFSWPPALYRLLQNARKCSQSFSIAALYFEHCPFLRPQAAQCVAWLTSLFDDCSDSQADSWTSHGIAHPGARPRACEQTAPTTNAHQNFRSWPYRFELFVQYARIIHISRACRSLEPKKASSSLTTSAF